MPPRRRRTRCRVDSAAGPTGAVQLPQPGCAGSWHRGCVGATPPCLRWAFCAQLPVGRCVGGLRLPGRCAGAAAQGLARAPLHRGPCEAHGIASPAAPATAPGRALPPPAAPVRRQHPTAAAAPVWGRPCAAALTLLDVVVGQGAAVLQLLAGEDQALLIRGDACGRPTRRVAQTGTSSRRLQGRRPALRPLPAGGRPGRRLALTLLVLNLALDIFNGVRGLHLKGDGLTREGLHENLHPGEPAPAQPGGGAVRAPRAAPGHLMCVAERLRGAWLLLGGARAACAGTQARLAAGARVLRPLSPSVHKRPGSQLQKGASPGAARAVVAAWGTSFPFSCRPRTCTAADPGAHTPAAQPTHLRRVPA